MCEPRVRSARLAHSVYLCSNVRQELVRPRCTLETNVVGNRARAIQLRRSLMTEEDWSGTGETSETSATGSLSESSEGPAADVTWGGAAIGETPGDESDEIAPAALPAG